MGSFTFRVVVLGSWPVGRDLVRSAGGVALAFFVSAFIFAYVVGGDDEREHEGDGGQV
jgi:hypothetical protein